VIVLPEDRCVEILLDLAAAFNKAAKCFSDSQAHAQTCLEGLREISKIYRGGGLETIDLGGVKKGLEGIPLYGSAYIGGDPLRVKAELGSLYRSFGVREIGEMSDHISVELEFLSLLLAKAAYARAKGDRHLEEEAGKAIYIVCKEHLSLLFEGIGRAIEVKGDRASKMLIGTFKKILYNVERIGSSIRTCPG